MPSDVREGEVMMCSMLIVETLKLYVKFVQQKQYSCFSAYLMAYGYTRERANEMADWIQKHEEKTDAE